MHGGLLPEQVWYGDPIPERGLFPGRPSGSAMRYRSPFSRTKIGTSTRIGLVQTFSPVGSR